MSPPESLTQEVHPGGLPYEGSARDGAPSRGVLDDARSDDGRRDLQFFERLTKTHMYMWAATPSQEENHRKSQVPKDRLGELLLKNKLINEDQLKAALRRRAQTDLPLGSILIEMNLITADILLDFLSKKFSVAFGDSP